MQIAIPLTKEHIRKNKPKSNLHNALSRAINAHPKCKNASVNYEPFHFCKSGIWSEGEVTLTLKDTGTRITFELYHDAMDLMYHLWHHPKYCNDGTLYLTDEYETNYCIYEENKSKTPIEPLPK